jgi:hypothetical protein
VTCDNFNPLADGGVFFLRWAFSTPLNSDTRLTVWP